MKIPLKCLVYREHGNNFDITVLLWKNPLVTKHKLPPTIKYMNISRCQWFETPWSLYDVTVINKPFDWRHYIILVLDYVSTYWRLCYVWICEFFPCALPQLFQSACTVLWLVANKYYLYLQPKCNNCHLSVYHINSSFRLYVNWRYFINFHIIYYI